MAGALVGFRVGNHDKLLRLHGERSCAGVLRQVQHLVLALDDDQLARLAHALEPVRLFDVPASTLASGDAAVPVSDAVACSFSGATADPSFAADLGACATWADAFENFPELTLWERGVPCRPLLALDQCADVVWGLVIDVATRDLHIYDNRNARFRWSELGVAGAPYATLSLASVRALDEDDIASLQRILLLHAYADGLDPALPLRDALSDPVPGPDRWTSRLQVQSGHVALTLRRADIGVQVRRARELALDDAGFGSLLQEALDPQLRELALAVYGPGATLQQLGRLVPHLGRLPFQASALGLPLLTLALEPGDDLGLQPGPHYFEELRALLIRHGLTVGGWRFLLRQHPSVLRAILQYFPPSLRIAGEFGQFIDHFANALQSTPLPPERCQAGLRGVDRILDRTRGRPTPLRRQNAEIYLRALVRAQLSGDEINNLGHEALDVADYVAQTQHLLRGATWRSLQRRSDQWHRALMVMADPERDLQWPKLLPRFEAHGFVALELNTGRLLAEEGLAQRHCIGTYVNACVSGSTRVFSIRSGARRAATLELQRRPDAHWAVVQLRGKANSVIEDPHLIAAADALAIRYDGIARSRPASACTLAFDLPAPVAPGPHHDLGAAHLHFPRAVLQSELHPRPT